MIRRPASSACGINLGKPPDHLSPSELRLPAQSGHHAPFSESAILFPLYSEFYQIVIENERVYLILRYLVIKKKLSCSVGGEMVDGCWERMNLARISFILMVRMERKTQCLRHSCMIMRRVDEKKA